MINNFIIFFILLFGSLKGLDAGCVYDARPSQFEPKMEVTVCYCEYDGKILLLLRNADKPQGNTWCGPGGKIQKGETPLQAVIREVREEIGLILTPDDLLYRQPVYIRFPSQDFILHLYRAHFDEKPTLNISPGEHCDACWVPLQEALEMNLIPGGKECLQIAYEVPIDL